MSRFITRKVRLGTFGVPAWAIALAVLIVAAVAGQAVGPVLSGAVTGSANLAVSQTVVLTTAVSGARVNNPVNVTGVPPSLGSSGNGSAGWSTAQSYPSGGSSARLQTGATLGSGHEGRIVINMIPGTTLNDLSSISWRRYAVSGYQPHLDITLDVDNDGVVDNEDMLTAEMVHNTTLGGPPYPSIATVDAQVDYNVWEQTFELAPGDGKGEINNSTLFWVTRMGAGDLDAPSGTLAQWKAGLIGGNPQPDPLIAGVITGSARVVKLEIEVDNWVVNSEAYLDSVSINGITYDLEPTSNLPPGVVMKGVGNGTAFAPTAADDFTATVNDEGTAFTVALETQVGQISVVGLKLDNQSGTAASAILEISAPPGLDIAVDNSTASSVAGKVTGLARLSKNTWLFAVDSAAVDDIADIYIAVEPQDGAAPGFYTITGRIVQVEG